MPLDTFHEKPTIKLNEAKVKKLAIAHFARFMSANEYTDPDHPDALDYRCFDIFPLPSFYEYRVGKTAVDAFSVLAKKDGVIEVKLFQNEVPKFVFELKHQLISNGMSKVDGVETDENDDDEDEDDYEDDTD